MSSHSTDHLWERIYAALALLLIALGIISIASIGLPLLILGTGLLAAWPLRHRRAVFLGVVSAILTFFGVGMAVAPATCRTSAQSTGETRMSRTAETRCTSVIGITYEGGAGYDPPMWPALLGGAAAGVAAGSTLYLLQRLGFCRNE